MRAALLVPISLVVGLALVACSDEVETDGSVSLAETTTASPTESASDVTPTPSPSIAPYLDKCLVRAADPPVMPGDPDAQLQCIVVMLGTATPVPGVHVVAGNETATTDERGHFHFYGLASESEPDVRLTVFVDDDRFAQWEVRNLDIHWNTHSILIIQVSETERFYTEHRTPDAIDRLGVIGTSPLNFQPTAVWETFNEMCDPWTGEPTPAPS